MWLAPPCPKEEIVYNFSYNRGKNLKIFAYFV